MGEEMKFSSGGFKKSNPWGLPEGNCLFFCKTKLSMNKRSCLFHVFCEWFLLKSQDTS